MAKSSCSCAESSWAPIWLRAAVARCVQSSYYHSPYGLAKCSLIPKSNDRDCVNFMMTTITVWVFTVNTRIIIIRVLYQQELIENEFDSKCYEWFLCMTWVFYEAGTDCTIYTFASYAAQQRNGATALPLMINSYKTRGDHESCFKCHCPRHEGSTALVSHHAVYGRLAYQKPVKVKLLSSVHKIKQLHFFVF